MSQSNQHRLAKRIRLAARIIGLLAVGFTLVGPLVGGVFEAIAGDWEVIIEIEGILLIVLGVIGLTGCIVSWWGERLAGILLILTAVGLGIHIGFYAGRNHVFAWLMMGFPYLVAGVLFLSSWRLSRKTP